MQVIFIFEHYKLYFLKNKKQLPLVIFSNRLILLPFTLEICEEILNGNFDITYSIGLKKGRNWPDSDILETLPRIIANLSKVNSPTGFESWMIVKKETNEIIGDIGFKGFDALHHSCDLGYGIIEAERRKGYAEEASKCLIDWVLNTDSSIDITASTHLGNTGSINLLQKLNFIEIKRDSVFRYWQLVKN
ncbi:hypothetical protein CBW16_12200 [Flavobacteriaceae bacterium JJC]|nr:hypothetical protein CBW16_12200 [Flavobacteriaceae bacterium JJC]